MLVKYILLVFLFCAQTRALYSLSVDASIRLEKLLDPGVHAKPATCRAGANTFVAMSTDNACYLHAADADAKWTCSVLPQTSVAMVCVDAANLGLPGTPSVFAVDANATVRVTGTATPALPGRLPNCSDAARVEVASVEWYGFSRWNPDLNGIFALYACDDGRATCVAYYSLHDALHALSPVAKLVFSTSCAVGTSPPVGVDVALFPEEGCCAVAFARGSRVFSMVGIPRAVGASGYEIVWDAAREHATNSPVTSVAVVEPDLVAYAEASDNASTLVVLNATTDSRTVLATDSSATRGRWTVLAENLENATTANRDLLLSTGEKVLRFVRKPGTNSWTKIPGISLSFGTVNAELALSRGSFASYPFVHLVAEVRHSTYATLEYYYGHDVECAQFRGRPELCEQHQCAFCGELGVCVEGECPVCEEFADEQNCTSNQCLWCDEVLRCNNPLTPCELCRHRTNDCNPPCVFCNGTQTCFSKTAVCTFCPEYTANLSLCSSSPSCSVCEATQECLSVQDSCFDCHQNAVLGMCTYDPRCGWCAHPQSCEGIHSDVFNPASPASMCLCSDAKTEADCVDSAACAWMDGDAQCVPARCVGGKPGPMDFAATIVRILKKGAQPNQLDEFDRIAAPGESVGSAADLDANFYVACNSVYGPYVIKGNSVPEWVCENVFAGPTTTITGMGFDLWTNLVIVVGGGRDLPTKTQIAPRDVGFSSAVKTEECFLAAFNSTDCTMMWAVPWGSNADGEKFTDVEITDAYIAVSGIVGFDFPVNGMCAPEHAVGLSGIVLIYDHSWNLLSCHFCGTAMNHLSTQNGRLAAIGTGLYGDRAMLLRHFTDSDTWLCDYVPTHATISEASAVAVFQDPTDDYFVALVPTVQDATGSASRLLVLQFYERSPVVLLEEDLRSTDPSRVFKVTAVQSVYSSFLALDLGGYVYNETTAHPIFGALRVGTNSSSGAMEVKKFAYQVWVPEQGGVSKFNWMDKFLNFIYIGGSTTEDNFLSTSSARHGPDHEPNPFGILMMRPDHDLQCLPPLPVPPQWAIAKPLLPSSNPSTVEWPSFNFTWDSAYFAFTNSRYVFRVGDDYVTSDVFRNTTWATATLPFAFDEQTVPWAIEARTPYSSATTNGTVSYRVVPRPFPRSLLGLAAVANGGLNLTVTGSEGATLFYQLTSSALSVDTNGYTANVVFDTDRYVFNVSSEEPWVTFATASHLYSTQDGAFWTLGFPKFRLTSYDGFAEWSAVSAACTWPQETREWMRFGIPIFAESVDTPPNDTCGWHKAFFPPTLPHGLPDLRGVFAISISFRSAGGQIISLRIANLTTAETFFVRFAAPPSSSSADEDDDAGDATSGAIGLVGLFAIAPIALLVGAVVYLYRRVKKKERAQALASVQLGLLPQTDMDCKFSLKEAENCVDLGGFPLCIPEEPLTLGYDTAPMPVEQEIVDTFDIWNATGDARRVIEEAFAESASPCSSPSSVARSRKWTQPNSSGGPTATTSDRTATKSSTSSSGAATTRESHSSARRTPKAAMPSAKYAWRLFAKTTPAVSLSFHPDGGCLGPRDRATIRVTMVANCTTTRDQEVMVAICGGATFDRVEKYAHFTIKVNTVMSSKLDPDEFAVANEPVGSGAFGAVYRGTYRGLDVAVKILKNQNPSADERGDFENEVGIMEKAKSPFIINFIGACHFPRNYAIVTEFCQLGNLRHVMAENKLDELLKIRLLLDCAKGMDFMHQSGAIHRDLKPDNLLVFSFDPNAVVCCKISDMGTGRLINKSAATQYYTKGMGTPVYMAPEILNGDKYSNRADVYSFAMVVYFVMSEVEPYNHGQGEFTTTWIIAEFVRSGKRLPIPETVPEYAIDIIHECWHQDPALRPSFADVAVRLTKVFNEENSREKSIRRHHHRRHKRRRHNATETDSGTGTGTADE